MPRHRLAPLPAGMDNDSLLRLLAEAFGKMRGWDASQGDISEQQLEQWLQQLLQLVNQSESEVQPGSGTVPALHGILKQQHEWLRLGQVYNALVYLREKHHRLG
jgi:hypothetical protein